MSVQAGFSKKLKAQADFLKKLKALVIEYDVEPAVDHPAGIDQLQVVAFATGVTL